MKFSTYLILFILVMTHLAFAETTLILIGGGGTELSEDGVISGNGSTAMGGLGAAVTDTFIIYYQPLGEGDWGDNVFPDPEVYSFQMDLVDHLPVWQSCGRHGSFWDSRGRNGDGIYPWINRDWREGRYYDHQYRATGDDPPFGHVHSDADWTINYWDGDEDNRFFHTCLSGTAEDFVYDAVTRRTANRVPDMSNTSAVPTRASIPSANPAADFRISHSSLNMTARTTVAV